MEESEQKSRSHFKKRTLSIAVSGEKKSRADYLDVENLKSLNGDAASIHSGMFSTKSKAPTRTTHASSTKKEAQRFPSI
jgi:hypothetical protein